MIPCGPVSGRFSLRALLAGVAPVLLFVTMAAAARRVESVEPRIEEITFPSAALAREMKVVVVRPGEGGDPSACPVLYLLHGRCRHRRSLIDDPASCRALLEAQCWVVLPDGEDGWYSDTPVGRYASNLTEVMQEIEAHYGLNPTPARRAIAGWSMGGYGAVRFAQSHPHRFGIVAAILGLLDFPREPVPPADQNYPVPADRFGADPAAWSAANPLRSIEALRGKAVLVVTGTDAFDRTMNVNFSVALSAAGIPHEYRLLPGSHTFPVVRDGLPLVLEFVRRSIR